jgi:hypothetical protein
MLERTFMSTNGTVKSQMPMREKYELMKELDQNRAKYQVMTEAEIVRTLENDPRRPELWPSIKRSRLVSACEAVGLTPAKPKPKEVVGEERVKALEEKVAQLEAAVEFLKKELGVKS